MKADNILQTIGNTPHMRINRLFGAGANVWIKSERSNPGGSIKDRIALAMVEDAEKSGRAASPAAPSSSPPRATPASAWPWWPPSRATSWFW
jgi:threonine synthase